MYRRGGQLMLSRFPVGGRSPQHRSSPDLQPTAGQTNLPRCGCSPPRRGFQALCVPSCVQVTRPKVDRAEGVWREGSRMVAAGGPSPGTREGLAPTTRGDHPDGGDGPIKAIGPRSGWPRKEDYHRTLGYCIPLTHRGLTLVWFHRVPGYSL